MNIRKWTSISFLAVAIASIGIFFGIIILKSVLYGAHPEAALTSFGILLLSLILTIQGLFTLTWMLYAWENPKEAKKHRSPDILLAPHFSFTALLPARHEEKVIGDTIRAIDAIHYPSELKEIIVLIRFDDTETIAKAQETIDELKNPRIRLEVVDGFPINKPHSLNIGLQRAQGNIVTIFDAEDQPHPYIYGITNTTFLQQNADVVQSGVQLMNHTSTWFSALNCMEYYFWFKSGLAFFSSIGKTTPLGGNTVFFKRERLFNVGGWDEHCLTEDADIGFRLSAVGAKTHIIYEEAHVTQEETPDNTMSFMKQRTRWNQGFLQILSKGIWSQLPEQNQKMTALYVLLSPEMQALLLLYTPFAAWISVTQKFSILVSLLSFVPLLLLALQITVIVIGLYEFTKAYNKKFSWWMPLLILVTFYPYQIVLTLAACRAMVRHLVGSNSWEKTQHTNAHRVAVEPLPI